MEEGSEEKNGPIFDPILKKLYYDVEGGSSFGGVKELYKSAKKQAPDITLKIVDNFLHRQKVYVDHKQKVDTFDRRMYTTDEPKSIFGLDLVFLPSLKSFNQNRSIILTAVDFFSR